MFVIEGLWDLVLLVRFPVREKGACNRFFIQMVVVEPPLPPVQVGYRHILNDQAFSANAFSLHYTLYDAAAQRQQC